MTGRMVRIKNTTGSTVNVYSPAYNINRDFPGKGAIQMIPFETVEQLLWDQGFKNLIMSGILYIDDMQTKIDLGLEQPDTKVPTNIKVFTPDQMLTILKIRSFEEFKKEIDSAPVEQANEVVRYAVEHNLIDEQKVNYLKKRTGKDVIAMIARRRLEADAERVNMGREQKRPEGVFTAV